MDSHRFNETPGQAQGGIRGSRKAIAVAFAVCALLLAGGVTLFVPQASVAMQQAASQLSDFLNRSPGERTDANLAKGKGKGAPVTAQRGMENVLDPIDEPAESPDVALAGDTPVLTLPEFAEEAGVPQQVAAIPPLLSSGGPGGVGFFGGGGGSTGSGGGGGGGGGDEPEDPGEPPIDPPVAAVPEPSTWMMMIFGMFLCAAALRRRRRDVFIGQVA